MVVQAIVDVASSQFLSAGACVLTAGPGQLVVSMPDGVMPNLTTERYDATSPTLRRAATTDELTAASAATLNAQATAALNAQQVAKAILAEVLEVKLGRQLTVADIPTLQAMFQRAVFYYTFIVQNGL